MILLALKNKEKSWNGTPIFSNFQKKLGKIVKKWNCKNKNFPEIFRIKKLVEWKQTVRGDFFEIKLLLQPDVVFDSESNGRNFRSLAPPDGEKKIIFNFLFKMTSRVGVGVLSDILGSSKNL